MAQEIDRYPHLSDTEFESLFEEAVVREARAMELERRDFLRMVVGGGCALCTSFLLGGERSGFAQDAAPVSSEMPGKDLGATEANTQFTSDARFWETQDDKIICRLCPRECVVPDVERGYCGVRENQRGEYKTLVYCRPCSLGVDPIEKKPLMHFLPGTTALSLATAGCNMACKFCQNWQISQSQPEQIQARYVTPEQMARLALEKKSLTIAYTYSEPTIFYEYMYDVAKAGREIGVNSVMISNGYIQEKPMAELLPLLSAVKVDLKAFTEEFYRNTCAGELKPVLKILEQVKRSGTWLELVVLIIPTLNDSADECRRMCRWVFENLGPDVPIHFSRFHPQYRIRRLPPTPVRTLERNRTIALEAGLHYAYLGNVPGGHPGEHTYCPSCREVVIRRAGYRVRNLMKQPGVCGGCEQKIAGVWKNPLKS